jgi:hypothetical protein
VNRLDVHDARLDDLTGAITDRARSVEGLEEVVDRVGRMIQDRLDSLQQCQRNATAPLAWRARGKDSDKDNLVALLEAAESGGAWSTWTLPNSMRNTEAGINVLLRRPKVLVPPPMPRMIFSGGSKHANGADGPVDTIEDEEAADAVRRDADVGGP